MSGFNFKNEEVEELFQLSSEKNAGIYGMVKYCRGTDAGYCRYGKLEW